MHGVGGALSTVACNGLEEVHFVAPPLCSELGGPEDDGGVMGARNGVAAGSGTGRDSLAPGCSTSGSWTGGEANRLSATGDSVKPARSSIGDLS